MNILRDLKVVGKVGIGIGSASQETTLDVRKTTADWWAPIQSILSLDNTTFNKSYHSIGLFSSIKLDLNAVVDTVGAGGLFGVRSDVQVCGSAENVFGSTIIGNKSLITTWEDGLDSHTILSNCVGYLAEVTVGSASSYISNYTGFRTNTSGVDVPYHAPTWGSITNFTSFHSEEKPSWVTNHYHFYGEGDSPSYFGGKVETPSQFKSTLAIGTKPLDLVSTTLCDNLNADLLDGQHGSYYQPLLTNPTTGTGTANYLAKFTGASSLGNSLIRDDGTVVGIGAEPSSSYMLNVGGYIQSSKIDVSQTTVSSLNCSQTYATLQSQGTTNSGFIELDYVTNTFVAHKFVYSGATSVVQAISVRIKTNAGLWSNPEGYVSVKVYADSSGTLGALTAPCSSIYYGVAQTNIVEHHLLTYATLTSGATYWLVYELSEQPVGTIGTDYGSFVNTKIYFQYYEAGASGLDIVIGSGTPAITTPTHTTRLLYLKIYSSTAAAIKGYSSGGYGGYFFSAAGTGMYATSLNGIGITGASTNNYGVYGTSGGRPGVFGGSSRNAGVSGSSTHFVGVSGKSVNGSAGLFSQKGTLTSIPNGNPTVRIERIGVSGIVPYTGNILELYDYPTPVEMVHSGSLIKGYIDGTVRLDFNPRATDDDSSVVLFFDTLNRIESTGAKLLDLRNQGASRFSVYSDGSVDILGTLRTDTIVASGVLNIYTATGFMAYGSFSQEVHAHEFSGNVFCGSSLIVAGTLSIGNNSSSTILNTVELVGNMSIGFYGSEAPSLGLIVEGKIGAGVEAPAAVLHLKAGSAAAGTAPIKFTSGSLLTTPEQGTIEYYDGTFYIRGTTSFNVEKGGIFGTGVNNTTFEDDGSLVMYGDAKVWEDLRVPVTSTRTSGSKDPGFSLFKNNGSSSQGVFTYWFDSSSEEELYFSAQMPHSWDTYDITPHIHWIPKTNGSSGQTVRWGLEYTWANIGVAYSDTTILYTNTTTSSDTTLVAGKHYMSNFSAITPSSNQNILSSMLICRIFRDATSSTYDTYTDDAGLLEIDFHFCLNTLGSRTISNK